VFLVAHERVPITVLPEFSSSVMTLASALVEVSLSFGTPFAAVLDLQECFLFGTEFFRERIGQSKSHELN